MANDPQRISQIIGENIESVYIEVAGEHGIKPEDIPDDARCIMCTNIGIRVLHHFGIPAKPVPVDVLVGNQKYIEWVEAGGQGESPPDAAALIVHWKKCKTDNKEVWAGHLVVEVGPFKGQRFVADFDFRQFNRPQYDIKAPKYALFPVNEKWDDLEQVAWTDVDILYSLQARPSNNTWRTAPDWASDHADIVSKLIDIVKRES